MELEDQDWLNEPDTLKLRRWLQDEVLKARGRLEAAAATEPVDAVRFASAELRVMKRLYKTVFGGRPKDEDDEA